MLEWSPLGFSAYWSAGLIPGSVVGAGLRLLALAIRSERILAFLTVSPALSYAWSYAPSLILHQQSSEINYDLLI